MLAQAGNLTKRAQSDVGPPGPTT